MRRSKVRPEGHGVWHGRVLHPDCGEVWQGVAVWACWHVTIKRHAVLHAVVGLAGALVGIPLQEARDLSSGRTGPSSPRP